MLENVQSPLVEPITESDIAAILCASLDSNIEVVQHRQLTGGLFNTSYYIKTRRPAHEIILRVAPSDGKHATLFDYEKTMMIAEPAIYNLMRGGGVPVPDVLAIDSSGQVIPRHFILLRYINSTPMNDPSIPEEVIPVLRLQLGQFLRKMHNITNEKFGHVQPDGSVQGDASWREVFGNLLDEAIRRCHNHNLVDTESLIKAEQYFIKHADVLDDPAIKPALIHGDLWEANVLLTQHEAVEWQIAAIIDADRALFADREFEAALWFGTLEFNEGYAQPLDDSDSAQLRRKLYWLYQDLFHVFVFGIQIPVPDHYKHHRQSVENLLTS